MPVFAVVAVFEEVEQLLVWEPTEAGLRMSEEASLAPPSPLSEPLGPSKSFRHLINHRNLGLESRSRTHYEINC